MATNEDFLRSIIQNANYLLSLETWGDIPFIEDLNSELHNVDSKLDDLADYVNDVRAGTVEP